jgi:transcription antitermination factor NusG
MTRPIHDNPNSLFPEDVLDQELNDKTWRVAHCKSRREKALANFLVGEKIGYYLPMVLQPQASKKRVRLSLIPLFRGYLFFKSSDLERYRAMCSNHIARIIDIQDHKRLITELKKISQVLGQKVPVYPFDFVQTGQWVRIKKGPFKDLEGIVVQKKDTFRLVLSVTCIMQSISIEIDAEMIEPLEF